MYGINITTTKFIAIVFSNFFVLFPKFMVYGLYKTIVMVFATISEVFEL